MLVIDDTAIPKKGEHSVGVAAQYASALGKTANCQTLVSLTLARGEVPVPVALRLFLPQSWTNDPARLQRAGVPVAHRTARTKPQIALAEIDRLIAGGARFRLCAGRCRLWAERAVPPGADASQPDLGCRHPRHLKVYPVGVQLIFPIARRGRPRQRSIPDVLSVAAEDMLADAKWQNITWRTGTKGKLKARFAAVRVRTADGPPQRIRDKGQQHLPGDEAWLVGEQRASGEKKYYLANLPARHQPAHVGRHHQGAMGLRTGPSADERRTRPRSLRGPILARPSPSRAHDDDRLRLPPASPGSLCDPVVKERLGIAAAMRLAGQPGSPGSMKCSSARVAPVCPGRCSALDGPVRSVATMMCEMSRDPPGRTGRGGAGCRRRPVSSS